MQLSKTLLWLLTILWFAGALWWYSSSPCSSCNASSTIISNVTSTVTPVVNNLTGFSVSDSSWNASADDNLRFGKSASFPVMSQSVKKAFDEVAAYSKANLQKSVTVTGHYAASEINNTGFENLGLARADTIKKWLVVNGVPALNIITKAALEASPNFNPADTLVGGISIAFNSIAPVAVSEDLFKPFTVYFATGQNSLNVSGDLQTYLQQANAYLQTHTDKKMVVTGHTDNVGNAEKNKALSAQRAAFVKTQLEQQGIAADKINSQGKGMTEPVEDNSSEEGRAKNRRVTIQLQ